MNQKTIKKHTKSRKINLHILKKDIIILTTFVFCVLCITLFINAFSAKANANNTVIPYKYYKSIEIQKGDTLWSIAGKYMDDDYYKNKIEYIREVKEINSLGSNKIVSGRYIIIPYYSYEYL